MEYLIAIYNNIKSASIPSIIAILFFTSLLTFLPENSLEELSIQTFVVQYKVYISLFFLLSISLLGSYVLFNIFCLIKDNLIEYDTIRNLKKQALYLSKEEKAYLKTYIDNDKSTQYYEITDGIAGGLESKKFLIRTTNVGTYGSFSYNIQPWAREHLIENRKLLD